MGCPRWWGGGTGTSLGRLERAGGGVCTRLNLAPRRGRADGGSESTAAVAVAVAAVAAKAKAPAAKGAASGQEWRLSPWAV
jgi:hypothetical protein